MADLAAARLRAERLRVLFEAARQQPEADSAAVDTPQPGTDPADVKDATPPQAG